MNQNSQKPNFVAFLKAKLAEHRTGGQPPEASNPVNPGFNPQQNPSFGFDPNQQNPIMNPIQPNPMGIQPNQMGAQPNQFQQPNPQAQFNNPEPFNPMQAGFNNLAQPTFNPVQETDQFGNPILKDQFGNPINPNIGQPVNPFDPNKPTQGN